MVKLFGEKITDLKYYWFKPFQLDDINLMISRTGWSSELGYEIYLLNESQGDKLYEKIMQTGEKMGLKPGHTSTIRRIEGGMLSYHADMNINTNPFELGLERLIDLDKDFDFIGKPALINILKRGIQRKQIGLEISGDAIDGSNTRFWNIYKDNEVIGMVTSAVYSPRLKKNIALAIINLEYSTLGTKLEVEIGKNKITATIVEKPFYDPKKAIAHA